MAAMTLYGFDGSTYVRTVKMLLAEKGFSDFTQVPVDVLKGEPKSAEHLQRHPFGKVPVLEHDGLTILETSAIARYLRASDADAICSSGVPPPSTTACGTTPASTTGITILTDTVGDTAGDSPVDLVRPRNARNSLNS